MATSWLACWVPSLDVHVCMSSWQQHAIFLNRLDRVVTGQGQTLQCHIQTLAPDWP